MLGLSYLFSRDCRINFIDLHWFYGCYIKDLVEPHSDFIFIYVQTHANTFISSMLSRQVKHLVGQVECQGHLPGGQVTKNLNVKPCTVHMNTLLYLED